MHFFDNWKNNTKENHKIGKLLILLINFHLPPLGKLLKGWSIFLSIPPSTLVINQPVLENGGLGVYSLGIS